MNSGRRALIVLGFVAALVLPATPRFVLAEPAEPAIEWVKTGDDTAVSTSLLNASSGTNAASHYEALTDQPGFLAYDHNINDLTLRLIELPGGHIESYRATLQQLVVELTTQTGMHIQVAPGVVTGFSAWNQIVPADGEIGVVISRQSPCGTLTTSKTGCAGAVKQVLLDGVFRLSAGMVFLNPSLATGCYPSVTRHAVGHVLGLQDFDEKYLGKFQIMHSVADCSRTSYRAGDLNGVRWTVANPPPANDNFATASRVCPWRDTNVHASTYFSTSEPGEPAHGGVGPRRSLWFRWTPESAGTATITTFQNGFDTVLAVYTGSMFAGAVPIVSNDNNPNIDPGAPRQGGSAVTFSAATGTTYWIALDAVSPGYSGKGTTDISFDLPSAVQPPAPPDIPQRLLDTRVGGQTYDCLNEGGGTVRSTTYLLPVRNRAFVPNTATSVVLNVTAIGGDFAGFVTVFPCGGRPNASNLNFDPGEVVANLVISKLESTGSICVYVSTIADVIVDVSRYFTNADALHPLTTPARMLDTRPGAQTADGAFAAVGHLVKDVPFELLVAPRLGVDASATAVVMNVTAIGPTTGGYLSVYPCGQPPPNASNLNFSAGDVKPNAVLAGVGAGGKVCFISSTTTELAVDVTGFYLTNPDFVSLPTPARMLDTRSAGSTADQLHQRVGRIQAGATYELPIAGRTGGPPPTALFVVLNVTAVGPSSTGYITVFPCGSPQPNASNLNFVVGDVVPNAVVAKVGTDGKVCFFSSAQTDLVVDVSGYYAA